MSAVDLCIKLRYKEIGNVLNHCNGIHIFLINMTLTEGEILNWNSRSLVFRGVLQMNRIFPWHISSITQNSALINAYSQLLICWVVLMCNLTSAVITRERPTVFVQWRSSSFPWNYAQCKPAGRYLIEVARHNVRSYQSWMEIPFRADVLLDTIKIIIRKNDPPTEYKKAVLIKLMDCTYSWGICDNQIMYAQCPTQSCQHDGGDSILVLILEICQPKSIT